VGVPTISIFKPFVRRPVAIQQRTEFARHVAAQAVREEIQKSTVRVTDARRLRRAADFTKDRQLRLQIRRGRASGRCRDENGRIQKCRLDAQSSRQSRANVSTATHDPRQGRTQDASGLRSRNLCRSLPVVNFLARHRRAAEVMAHEQVAIQAWYRKRQSLLTAVSQRN